MTPPVAAPAIDTVAPSATWKESERKPKESLIVPNVNDGQVITAVDTVPISHSHPVPRHLDRELVEPGTPRVNEAVDKHHPHGSPNNEPRKSFSVLQQHMEFFDRNKDGIIYPWETYAGFRALGFNFLFCIAAILLIHGAFAYPSQDGWIPELLFPIHLKNAHRLKHGSDTGIYDREGRFIPQKFEEMFVKFKYPQEKAKAGQLVAEQPEDALDFQQFMEMTRTNRDVNDPTGWIAAKFEWFTIWLLVADKQGRVSKEAIRRQYDGTLFYQIEAERNAKKEEKKKK